jgi:hypothetical protein
VSPLTQVSTLCRGSRQPAAHPAQSKPTTRGRQPEPRRSPLSRCAIPLVRGEGSVRPALSIVSLDPYALVTGPAPEIVTGRRYNTIKRWSPSLARQADVSATRPRHAADFPGGPMPTPPSQPPGAGRTGPTPQPGTGRTRPTPGPGTGRTGPRPEPGARPPRTTPTPETRKTTRQGCQREAGRPLPDPAAVRLCAVPDSAPPYDDEALAGTRSTGTAHTVRAGGSGGTAGGGQESASGRAPQHPVPDPARLDPARPKPASARSARPNSADPSSTRPSSARPHPARPHPAKPTSARPDSADPSEGGPDRGVAPGWPSLFAQVLAETLAGSRPAGQIVPWTTQRARSKIQRLGPTLAGGQPTARQRPLVRRVVTSQPRSDVLEMTVIVGFGPRIRALAVRLELSEPRGIPAGRAARWLCTTVEAA